MATIQQIQGLIDVGKSSPADKWTDAELKSVLTAIAIEIRDRGFVFVNVESDVAAQSALNTKNVIVKANGSIWNHNGTAWIKTGSGSSPLIDPASQVTIYYNYSATDPYVNDNTVPNVSFTQSIISAHNADISVLFPEAAINKYIVFKVPSGESQKTSWYNDSPHQGEIPDQAFRAGFTISGFTYYVSTSELVFDHTHPIQLKY